jgi:hypothetical protein
LKISKSFGTKIIRNSYVTNSTKIVWPTDQWRADIT